MTELLPDFIIGSARRLPDAPALRAGNHALSYAALAARMDDLAHGFVRLGLERGERVAIYLEKRVETVLASYAAARAGGVFVPVNPLLRPRQVAHILNDCTVRILVTSTARLTALEGTLAECRALKTIVVVDDAEIAGVPDWVASLRWSEIETGRRQTALHRTIDSDVLAILYTSGSTGLPKGVVLSHRNMVAGARSVSQYLGNNSDDRILCVLPLSFDAGFSQLNTAFNVGACAVLIDYLLPRDVVNKAAEERITGITGVPPLWNQLAELQWPKDAVASMRYFANTGGHMPRTTLQKLRAQLPKASPFLMYGLTEAFRSTYLPPAEVDRRPDSMGKAIPNVEILVVNEAGGLCGPNEPGELVHRGPLVSLGYWNDLERTSQRFKPAPANAQRSGVCMPEIAVWSGDTVRMDEDGFLYFIGRRDEMIKSSGYRISPTEVEEVIYGSGLVREAVVIGVAHPKLGQGIVVAATPPNGGPLDSESIIKVCREQLPPFMVPHLVAERPALARNPNGKIDRKALQLELANVFGGGAK
jgi:acyl-CoA ligase (AMP-forming) (exosortase A-associated)